MNSKMRLKTPLINICIRHKYITTQGNNTVIKSFPKKKLTRLIKRQVLKPNDAMLTSKDTNECVRASEIQRNVSNEKYILPLFLKDERKDIQISPGKDYVFNVPDIPNNFEEAFLSPFAQHRYISKTTKDNTMNEDKNEMKENISKRNNCDDSNRATRFNEINMQMISQPLYDQLFKNSEHDVPSMEKEINSIKATLSKYGINTEETTRIPDVDIQLPPLEGKDLEEHFFNIAKAQIKPYIKHISEIIDNIPEMPKEWLFQEGWTRYTINGAEKVDYPLEHAVILDVEVCMKEGPFPTLATAVSNKAWYGWVSKSLTEDTKPKFDKYNFNMDMLIPMESNNTEYGLKLNDFQKKPKLIIGHNVSYDRVRIKEQYWLKNTGTRFIDTMSLHVCVSGINSYQRAILKSVKEDEATMEWTKQTSLNNLADVHKLYCGSEIDKQIRQVFVEGSLDDIKKQFNDLMRYCAMDVVATHNVFHNLFPIFQERFPHPVTFSGMLELGCAYLPVNSNWQRYVEEAEFTFEDLNYEAKLALTKRADAVCHLMHNDKYKEDLWMWDQDWSTQSIKVKSQNKRKQVMDGKTSKEKTEQSDFQKYLTDDEGDEDPLEKEFSYLNETKKLLPLRMPHMPGYPAWYRKLCPKKDSKDWVLGPYNISTSMQVVPKLLNLTWENYPLHYKKEYGWGILVPYNDDPNIDTSLPLKQLFAQCPLPKSKDQRDVTDHVMSTLRMDVEKDLHKTEFWRYKKKKNDFGTDVYKGTGIWCNIDIDNCCYFFKLPHKDGSNFNVGNPLAKDFLNKFSENVLAGLNKSASQILKIARMTSYWRNNRDRIMSQLVIWFEEQYLPSSIKKKKKSDVKYGAILPQVVVAGTLTRRAVEATWMTASNAHIERIGSELRSMIQAPPGYNIVGADVDSQELWIASIVGDSHFKKIQGATPFGWMTLIGNKSNGTDMHSITAKAVGISRDHAKIINYARIYGAGQKFAEKLLKQFNPSMTNAEAASKSRKMLTLTKGKKVYRLRAEYINDDFEDKQYSMYEAFRIAEAFGKSVNEVFKKSEWIDGSESAMFNRLEQIAGSPNPVTPFLNSKLSRALEGLNNADEKYLPTKINWVVQSGAVDFLHLMLVSMKWLMRDNVRFCLSFHDEVRYLVPSQYKYNAALAMHVTNLLTRAFCVLKLGMKDLPMSVAFFTAVEVDTVLRKDSANDCKTPSNPHGLENGYEILPGESLDIWKALEKSGGSLGSWHQKKLQKLKE